MRVGFLIGVGGGLASALLFYSAARGSPLLEHPPAAADAAAVPAGRPRLGLAAGRSRRRCRLAGDGGRRQRSRSRSAISWRSGLPVALAAHLAYLSRPDPQDPNLREWYPAGRLLRGLSLYGGALPVLVLPLIGGSYEVLRAPMGEFFRRLSTRAPRARLASRSPTRRSRRWPSSSSPSCRARWRPTGSAIFALNLYLAGRIARASGRLGRDWPDLPALAYPPGFPLLVALALVASFVPGTIGVAGTSFSGALLLAYLLAGLALMHFIARGRAPWILWFVYAALVLFEPYTAVVLMLGGLLEPALKLRRRFGASPPST